MFLIGLVILAVLLILGGLGLLVFQIVALSNTAPAVMTPSAAKTAVLAALDLPEQGLLVDLGCGDGRLMKAAAAQKDHLGLLGVENNPVLAALGVWRLRGRGRVKWGNIMNLNCSEADRVFLYLSPKLMRDLELKLERELQPGARVVSMHYAFPNRRESSQVEIAGGPAHARKLYVYEY